MWLGLERSRFALTSPAPSPTAAWAQFVLCGPPKPSARMCLSCFLATNARREHCAVCLMELVCGRADADSLDIHVYLCVKCMHAVHAECMHGWHVHQGSERGSCPTCREKACDDNYVALNLVCQCNATVCELPREQEQEQGYIGKLPPLPSSEPEQFSRCKPCSESRCEQYSEHPRCEQFSVSSSQSLE